ncbi:MAG: hypothetical protein PHW04_03650 [Candidatus Wallbacteria bacterium]|nr:hypothetical protein [Candidatus Wallbacteria bacterium]
MKLNEHCQESLRLFGKPWTELHQWLDEFAGVPGVGFRHRRFRHHEAGIRTAVIIFGPEAESPARRHIMSDLAEEGWKEGVDPFPADAEQYKKMGFF